MIFRYNLFALGSHHPRFALPFQSILLSSSKFFTYADIIVENLSIRQGVFCLFLCSFSKPFPAFSSLTFRMIPAIIEPIPISITTPTVQINTIRFIIYRFLSDSENTQSLFVYSPSPQLLHSCQPDYPYNNR